MHRVERRVQIDVEKAYRRAQRVTSLAAVAREALSVRREALRISKDQFELGLCGRAAYEVTSAAAAPADADLAAVTDLDRLAGSQQ